MSMASASSSTTSCFLVRVLRPFAGAFLALVFLPPAVATDVTVRMLSSWSARSSEAEGASEVAVATD